MEKESSQERSFRVGIHSHMQVFTAPGNQPAVGTLPTRNLCVSVGVTSEYPGNRGLYRCSRW